MQCKWKWQIGGREWQTGGREKSSSTAAPSALLRVLSLKKFDFTCWRYRLCAPLSTFYVYFCHNRPQNLNSPVLDTSFSQLTTQWVGEPDYKGPNSNLEFPELRHCRVGKPDTREGTFQCCSPCHNGQTPVLVWKKVSPYIFHPGCINIGTFFSGICRTLGESWISSCSPEN